MNTLFINISREAIILQGKDIDEVLPYDDIERNFPKLFSQVVQEHEIDSIWLLNGPGGFMMLRVGCVTINTWNAANEKKLNLYTCSKLDLYSYAVEQGLLPETGVVYIGQKKKLRRCCYHSQTVDEQLSNTRQAIEHGNWNMEYLSIENVGDLEGKDYFVDQFGEHILLEQLDEKRMVEIDFSDDTLRLSYSGKEVCISQESVLFQQVERLEPEYLMEPTVG